MGALSNGTGRGGRDDRRPELPADRLPPQNLEAEMGVLGSVLLDNETWYEVGPTLKAEDFYRDAHQVVYRAVRDLFDMGKAVDAITLADELTLRDEIDRIGGIEFLAELVNGVPHAANAKYYADIVKQKSVSRGVIEACNASLNDAYSNQHTAEALADGLMRRATAVSEGGTVDNVTGLAVPVQAYIDRMLSRNRGPSGILSGFRLLDLLTDGWQAGMLYVVAGRPSMGKSVLALNVADCAASAGNPVLIFSLEMRSLELSERLICARSEVPVYRVRDPFQLQQTEVNRIADAQQSLNNTPIYFDDSPVYDLGQITAISRKYQRKLGIKLVVIDYLQLIDLDDGSRSNRQEQVAKASRRLKIMARMLDLPVLILSQLNRQSEAREDRRPRMADLRESGSIEQDADVVILVHRPDKYKPDDKPGVVELIVDKNRNGATGVVDVTNDLSRFRLLDRAEPHVIPKMAEDATDVRARAAGEDGAAF